MAYLALVDPELRGAALMMRETTASFTPMTLDKLEERRNMTYSGITAPTSDIPFEEISIERTSAPSDPGDVGIIVINARRGESRPGILHIHGGGYTASTAKGSLPAMQELASELDVPIVSVDYRLAPETTWRGSLEDNYSALLWMDDHARKLGLDPDRIAVTGESAGGGHAALLCLAARDRGEVSPCFQALVYPMIDDRSGTSRPLPEHIGYFGWNAEANRFGWECFLGQAPGGDDVPVEAVPSRRTDLAGLPPTWIGVGALDLFVEEDIAFAWALNAAGVPSELLVVPGAFHGFDLFVRDAAISRRFNAARVDVLRRGLGL